MTCRNLLIVLGDQLDVESPALDRLDRSRDAVLMMELGEEATYVPQHKIRLVLFFSAMRHFRDTLCDRGYTVHYVEVDDPDNCTTFKAEVGRWIGTLKPERTLCLFPGDHRVKTALEAAADGAGVPLDFVEDDHFYCAPGEFEEFASERKSFTMEQFYRRMRRRHDVLMVESEPAGGRWNFDEDNRSSFGKSGPPDIAAPHGFRPDDVTRQVIEMVERRFAGSPGALDEFDYPVTREQARAALRDFIEQRLHGFGTYQDAMAAGRPYLYHSRLSCVLNLHLLSPRETLSAALGALENDGAAMNDVEGFVRQIVGWREYVRGIYWWKMPGYAEMNALEADLPMPAFMWTAETEMRCVRQSVDQLVRHGYAHHIQRLMVLGLLSLLLGVRPYDVHRWHMSMYTDAIDWVSLPNVLGMSQFGDGGIMGTKPYAASGNYINKMSDYCAGCRFDPKKSTGEDACPFTTLYWDFLARNRDRLKGNHRMGFQFKNLERKDAGELRTVRGRAERLRHELTQSVYL